MAEKEARVHQYQAHAASEWPKPAATGADTKDCIKNLKAALADGREGDGAYLIIRVGPTIILKRDTRVVIREEKGAGE